MNKVRRDVLLHEIRLGHLRMALCVLFLPRGYALSWVEEKPVKLTKLVARTTLKHCDWIRNEWAAGRQVLVERINPNDPRAQQMTGDYMFATSPHTDENCPFRDADGLPLINIHTY